MSVALVPPLHPATLRAALMERHLTETIAAFDQWQEAKAIGFENRTEAALKRLTDRCKIGKAALRGGG